VTVVNDMFLFVLIAVAVVIGVVAAYYVRNSDVAPDSNLKAMLHELPQFYENAHKSIRIATDFDARFFEDDRVKRTLSSAAGRGVDVRIITEGQPSEWYGKQGFKMKEVERLARHVMIIDECHVRLEKPHDPGQFGKEGDLGMLYRNFPILATKWSDLFDQAWGSI